MSSVDTPILLIAWRRPHTLRQVIDAIRPVAPKRLYVACDGPNHDRPGEAEKVAATRTLIEHEIDWYCQMERLYSDVNQGCRLGVSRAITWFFEQVEEGIILEDDCVPHPDFFPYCTTLLERYRHDTRLWCISGNNFQDGLWRGDGSYYFSRYNHCWGWATWRRCWIHYDADLRDWPTLRDSGLLDSIFEDPLERNYWSHIWQRLHDKGRPDTWDYQWTFTCLSNGGLTALPNRNLVSNVGFGPDGTHTLAVEEPTVITQGIFPIHFPTFMLRNSRADIYFSNHNLLAPFLTDRNKMSRRLRRFGMYIRNFLKCRASCSSIPSALLSSRQVRRLSCLERYIPAEVTCSNNRKLRYVDACTLVAGNKEVFVDRVYDFETSNSSPVIVDCGANIGLASIWFGLRFPTARIYSYEADPDICSVLKWNLNSFGLSDQASVSNLAIWTDSNGVEFNQEGGFSGQVSSHSHELVKRKIRIPSISLQKVVDQLQSIQLLKIDIEGAENHIFQAGVNLQNIERVFIEYHSHENEPQSLGVILNELSRQGFRYHIKEAFPSPHPFLHVNTLLGMDLQLNIYASKVF